ncbi:hypothetical protein KSS87_019398, partial [Heliosperma pusillum]
VLTPIITPALTAKNQRVTVAANWFWDEFSFGFRSAFSLLVSAYNKFKG